MGVDNEERFSKIKEWIGLYGGDVTAQYILTLQNQLVEIKEELKIAEEDASYFNETTSKLMRLYNDIIKACQMLITNHDKGDLKGEADGWVEIRKCLEENIEWL